MKTFALAAIAAAMATIVATPTVAQEVVKIGLILPVTGPYTSVGREMEAGARLFMAQNGDQVAGKRIELILKDDTGSADLTKRLAQELIVNDKVAVLAGFALTPLALATSPLSAQSKTPMVVMSAATSGITSTSPYMVRTSFTLPEACVPLADWALKSGFRRVTTIVSDYAPGHDAETSFSGRFKAGGGSVDNVRVPLRNADFSPFLQRVADNKPDALFVFVPAGVGAQFMKQFVERGLDKSGIRLIGTGDVTDDDLLADMGDAALGAITTHPYSAAHVSPENKTFVADFEKANAGRRPNFIAVYAYDGMRVIYDALKKTGGDTNGDKLIAAMKGASWISPRGQVSIDPTNRELVQPMYLRKVERMNGQLFNVEQERVSDGRNASKAQR